MARGAEARAAMVAGADLGWLKQEFPTHQDMQISHERSIAASSSRPVAAEEGADGAVAYCAADASPKNHNAKSGQGHILDAHRERPAR